MKNEEHPCRCGRDRYSDDGECSACPPMTAEDKVEAIGQLIAAYRQADPPDIGHRIYVDLETILAG